MAQQDELESGPKVVNETNQAKVDDVDVNVDEKHSNSDTDVASTGGLRGVEKMQALTQTWTKPWLIAAYLL